MQTKSNVLSSPMRRLAKRIEDDIRMRGLCQGDRYWTAAEIAKRLGTSVTAAHHALKHLAERRVVVRRRNSGTFVGPAAGTRKASRIRTVQLLMPADYHATLARTDLLMQGILAQMDGASVQFNFVPDRDPVPYVKELISMANASGHVAGIVAARCRREVYRLLAESGIPTVVFGSLFPGEPLMPSIDTDARETGRLLTQYLIERGRKRIALLTGAEGWPGDNDFFDGVSQALTAARLTPNALLMRVIPHEETAFRATTRQLMEMANPPKGIITRGLTFADIIAEEVVASGRKMPRDVEIVFQDYATAQVEQSPYVHVQTKMRFDEVTSLVGKMLRTISDQKPLEQQRVVLSVELRKPERRKKT